MTVLFAVVRSTNRPKLRRTARIVVAALLAGSFIAGYIHHQRSTGVTTGTPDIRWAQATFLVLYLILLLLALPLLLVRAFAHRRVSINTVCATISGYLLIGLIFTTLYRLIGVFSPMFVQNPDPSLGDYSYFSFITLTTTGFGDLTARTDPQKAVVMLEALMGQIFMVTAVARVVSLLGSTRPDAEQLEARLQDD